MMSADSVNCSNGRSIGVADSLTGGLLVQALARQQGSGGGRRRCGGVQPIREA